MTLHIDHQDLNDPGKVASLIRMIDSQDPVYFIKVLDDMQLYQPFLLSVLLGYQTDLTPQQHMEVIKIFALIWEYFADHVNLRKKQVREADLEYIVACNIRMIKRFEKETSTKRKNAVLDEELAHINAKGLYAAVIHTVNYGKAFKNIGTKDRAYLVMGLKNIIECIEAL